MSAFTDGSLAHAIIELNDLNGKRLSDSMRVLSKNHAYEVNTGAVIFDETVNKAMLALTLNLHQPFTVSDRLNLSIDSILSGIEYVDAEPLGFNITIHAKKAESISKEEWINTAGGKLKMPGVSHSQGDEVPDIQKLLILDVMDVRIGEDNWAAITNIGIIDGRLHLQIKYNDSYSEYYNNGNLYLLDKEGNKVESSFDIRMGNYLEKVFDIGNGTDLEAMRLAFSGEVIKHIVTGPWEMSFIIDAETPKKSITVTPKDTTYFTKLDITCSPLATSVQMYSDSVGKSGNKRDFIESMGNYLKSCEMPYLTLDDGSIINLELVASMIDNLGGTADYESVYFDIKRLYSITFCGEEYHFIREQ